MTKTKDLTYKEALRELDEIIFRQQRLIEQAGVLFRPAADGGLEPSEIYIRPLETFFNKSKGLPFEDPRYD